jgi:hydrogenase-4 component B
MDGNRLVLGLGVASALLGVLYALMENDLKRLLAWSSIENIGIILMGFGAALMFRSLG